MTAASDMFSFETEDGHLAYRDVGVGRPLVLLHGGYLDHSMWDDQTPVLAQNYRVIAPDARGHGGSSNASRPFRQTDDLAALLRHLDVGPAVLVGLSMGASIAVDTALEHPDLVHALVVSGGGTSEREFHDSWTKGIFAEQARALAAGDTDGWINAALLSAAGPHRTLGDVDQKVVRRLREMTIRTIAKHTSTERDWSVPVTDTWARAAKITIPVLAINGGIDGDDLIGMAERLVHTVANGRAATVEGTAHYPNMERPDAFNEILGDFVQALFAQES
ncbi:alpha/beta fold hydrolase [Streptomyces sp. V1I1]|uniref:alpha/beta fold hydrolase n=1 Tax=Streptomyces sp. V1I1 TaxID=3042272 RepID=UPI0027823149|nr:alpha/beta hydrolase [Streptomyces sp. V1I1]MDQ0943842.1 pimeloyl-ACP methyl ester carboxylesterase [Streptomyces sp. V1I1]